jgi:predicted ribosome quality control (RQC) complex YloA/Tae2 family protein
MQRFVQFMRSRVRGGRITDIAQIGDDRIIRIGILRAGEELVIWIRLWSGAANIIVSDSEGIIQDAFYRRPGRGEISGGTFRLPDDSGKKKRREFAVRDLPGKGPFNERICRYYENIEFTE